MVTEDLPEPGPGEIRVETLAAGVSSYDVMLRGHWFPGQKPPYVPGEDIVGLVDELGDGVVGLEVGQRVALWTFGDAGGYAEYVSTPADRAVPVPDDLDSVEAVALVVNYLTASLAMNQMAGVRRGERMLAHGAAGGVGSALVQLGTLAGLEVYGTASAYNHDLVASLGAVPIDYRNDDFVAEIRELTGDGVDVAFDVIGGGRQLWRSSRALRRGGRLIMLGMASAVKGGIKMIPGSMSVVGLVKILPNGKTAPMGPGMESYPAEHMAWYRDSLAEFFDLTVTGKLEPAIAERFPLLEAARAHEFIERGGYAGKAVLTVG
ncbi:zinc-binding dehydrogenase [Ilumatobacter sp.]|uniref:zinc-binding dehydrogenase n=1 Tax=Ilumatobacter sp. TaxID=1967498 RepID=UPI003AF7BD07